MLYRRRPHLIFFGAKTIPSQKQPTQFKLLSAPWTAPRYSHTTAKQLELNQGLKPKSSLEQWPLFISHNLTFSTDYILKMRCLCIDVVHASPIHTLHSEAQPAEGLGSATTDPPISVSGTKLLLSIFFTKHCVCFLFWWFFFFCVHFFSCEQCTPGGHKTSLYLHTTRASGKGRKQERRHPLSGWEKLE